MSVPYPAERCARPNMRVSLDAPETIREAASAQQQDVTSFVLGAAVERARAILVNERALRRAPVEIAQVDEDPDEEPWTIPEFAQLAREARLRR
jgi:uncharacterized protein (DUF1778 family)